MALVEKQLAEALVDLRAQQATGTGYAPISVAIDALQGHLDAEQRLRALTTHIADAITVDSRGLS